MIKAINENADENVDVKKITLIQHLEELRKRIIISLVALFLGMIICFMFCQDIIFYILMAPLESLDQGLNLISVTEGFIVHIKAAFIGGLIIALPVILWQFISFVLPALYKKERKIFWLIFISSLLLFIFGIFFAYEFVLDFGLRFLLIDFSGGLTPMVSAAKYMSFIVSFLFPFGIIFEIPILTYIFTKAGIITPEKLRRKRCYIVLIIFIIAALLTPPDLFSQIMLALPMLLLYEISIVISLLVYRKRG